MTQETISQTSKGFEAFAKKLIDYAGLFPPAQLDPETVAKNFIEYREGDYSWVLGSLLCPISRLKELGGYLQQYNPEQTIEVAGIVTDETSAQQVTESIESFHKACGEKARVVSIEAKNSSIITELSSGYETYLEILEAKEIFTAMDAGCHVKVRCGGPDPKDYPSVETLASIIYCAKVQGVSLKYTAGLHHPIRHDSEDPACKMHGFVNVFGASMLSYKLSIDQSTIEEVLRDEDHKNFQFDDHGFNWKDLTIDIDSIKNARQYMAHSYGCCAFDEPIAGLKTLGWLS